MSRKGIRDGTAAYFGTPTGDPGVFAGGVIKGLNTIYTGEPRDVPDNAYLGMAPPGTPTGAVAFFFVEHQYDRRLTMQGSSVKGRWVHYELAMAVRVRSLQATGQAALDDHDAIVDGIVTAIRVDPTLGGAAAVWQAGMGDFQGNSDDIRVDSGLPRAIRKGGPILVWTAIRFQVLEIL